MDRILESFLKRQLEEGLKLAAASDIVDLIPLGGPPPQHYVVDFHCRGLVRTGKGEIRQWNRFTVGIFFPTDYLRSANPFADAGAPECFCLAPEHFGPGSDSLHRKNCTGYAADGPPASAV